MNWVSPIMMGRASYHANKNTTIGVILLRCLTWAWFALQQVVKNFNFIIGSAEALPILCVSDFCERERERETPVTSFDITLKSRVIMHMITSTARRPNASTRSEPVECSCIRQGAWCLIARAAGNGRVIYE